MAEASITKAVFPVAGLGTRFLPATKASPKEMLPLVDKPLIQYAVEEAVASGIEEIILVTGRNKRAIEDHFDSAFELEENLKAKGKLRLLDEVQRIAQLVTFCYIRQKEALGLGHAILCAKRLVSGEPFAVLLGDDLIDGQTPALRQLMKIFAAHRVTVLAVTRVAREETSHYGILEAQPMGERLYRVRDLVEKPKPSEAPSDLAIIGRYILTPGIFEALEHTPPGKGGEIQLTDGLRRLLKHESILAYEVEGTRYDAGDKLGFLMATVEYALKNPELGKPFRRYLEGLRF